MTGAHLHLYVWLQRHRPLLVAAGLGVLVLYVLVPDEALARVGGGQNFSTGRRRSGGGGGGGGGGIEGDILILLLHLAIEYPSIGIPLILLFVGFLLVRWWMENGGQSRVVHRTDEPVRHVPVARPVPGLGQLLQEDQGFSRPVFDDFVQLVAARAHAAIDGKGDGWAVLAPFVSDTGRAELEAAHPGVDAVDELVVGGLHLERINARGAYSVAMVKLDTTRLERRSGGSAVRMYVELRLVFRRSRQAQSLSPEATRSLGCPSCGAPVETTAMGACTHCGASITSGQLQWQLQSVKLLQRRGITPPQVGFWQGGDEPSVHLPSLVDSAVAANLRRFRAAHPEFAPDGFETRVRHVYFELQRAWSDGRWDEARPYVTDRMYQSLRFWVERYTREGLRNQLTDVRLHRIQLVRVHSDAWYEAITVRLWGSMKDAVIDRQGNVIGGNDRVDRGFSEYWTFLRTQGQAMPTKEQGRCPSCGAPLDNIGETGVCGYCDAKVTSGQYDWVLSRIDQVEAYRG